MQFSSLYIKQQPRSTSGNVKGGVVNLNSLIKNSLRAKGVAR